MPDINSTNLTPATLVIFGITGDLSSRYLLPALYYLGQQQLLPEKLKILGVTRHGSDINELKEKIRVSVRNRNEEPDEAVLDELSKYIEIYKMDMLSAQDYQNLKNRLDEVENEAMVCMNRLFYLAIPAQAYDPVIKQLGENKLNENCQHGTGNTRLLIEKPFGYDLRSAEELINLLHEYFSEEQVYRIDHYLAKETAQNILAFRFENPLFKKVWDAGCISRIVITAAEQIDIEGRVNFYEQTGALRDFVQSHMLQLMALTTMELPDTLKSDTIHYEKTKLLNSVEPVAANEVDQKSVRGQYDGYKQEVNNQDTFTESYAAIRMDINNDRWRGTPILLRTGKALKERLTEVTIYFSDNSDGSKDNILTFRIQPNEGIFMQFLAKKPGFDNEYTPVVMDFSYNRSFGNSNGHPDAYERVMIDAFRGDQTLFASSEEVLISWRIIENISHEWQKNGNNLYIYQKGSWGPKEAERLTLDAGGKWPEDSVAI